MSCLAQTFEVAAPAREQQRLRGYDVQDMCVCVPHDLPNPPRPLHSTLYHPTTLPISCVYHPPCILAARPRSISFTRACARAVAKAARLGSTHLTPPIPLPTPLATGKGARPGNSDAPTLISGDVLAEKPPNEPETWQIFLCTLHVTYICYTDTTNRKFTCA